MKNIAYLSCLLFVLLAGCGKEFLDKEPLNDLAAENFYRNEDDAIRALNGAYHSLQKPGCYNLRLWMLDIIAGNSIVGAGGGTDGLETQQAASFSTTSANPGVSDLWGAHFQGVLAANTVLDKVPGIAMDEGRKNVILAEASFLRALYYFNLVRLFGKVPLQTKALQSGDNLELERAPVAEVYQQIEADLALAEEVLPLKASEAGRATKGAAKGLLAKVLLTQGKWAAAAAKAQEVIGLGQYSLNPNFGTNFDFRNENGPESLFEVQYTYDPNNNGFSQEAVCSMRSEFMGPRNSGITGCCGFGWNQPTAEFVSQFEPGDKRKPVTIFSPGDTVPGFKYTTQYTITGWNVRKFLVTKSSGAQTTFANDPLNAVVLRYADVLLMHAEALNEIGNSPAALLPLNQVRQRAGLPDITETNQAALRDLIIKERRMELAFEGEWWFDLIRTKDNNGVVRAISFLKSLSDPSKPESPNDRYGVGRGNISEKALLFPIPQNERDNNPKMDQNLGY